MTEIPSWVVVAAGVFFVVNILLFVALIVAALYAVRFLNALMPRLASVEESVKGLVVRLHEVANRVEALATSIKGTVDGVGGRAKGVVGSAELVAQSASKQFERFSPFVVGALTAIRLVRALNEARKGRSLGKATSRAGMKGKRKAPFAWFGKG